MTTYREIQERVRSQAGWLPKTCWITHVKSDFGLPIRDAPTGLAPIAKFHVLPTSVPPSLLRYGVSG
jgi:hypothetical protein